MLNAPLKNDDEIGIFHDISKIMDWVCPFYKLDESVAINPWNDLTDQPIDDVFAMIATISDGNPYQALTHIRQAWDRGLITSKQLYKACEFSQRSYSREELVLTLYANVKFDNYGPFWKYAMNVDSSKRIQPHEFIIKNIGNVCAKYQARESLRDNWLNYLKQSKKFQVGLVQQLYRKLHQLPDNNLMSIAYCLRGLGISDNFRFAYLNCIAHASLGWSSYIKSLQNKAETTSSKEIFIDYISILVALDWAFAQLVENTVLNEWQATFKNVNKQYHNILKYRSMYWIWQLAFEISYQESLNHNLINNINSYGTQAKKDTLIITCIDTRSERLRRALEKCDPNIATAGYAGFFGIPLKVITASGKVTNQAPVILSPNYSLDLTRTKSSETTLGHYLIDLKKDHLFSLPAVEVLGPLYGFKLAKEYLTLKRGTIQDEKQYPEDLINCVINTETGQPLSLSEKVNIAYGILKDNQIDTEVPRHVIMVSHYASSVNNPHQSLLNCGACGGQSGSLNVAVATAILNEAEVKKALMNNYGYQLSNSHFIAAAHNTTTDNITIISEPKISNDSLDKLKKLFSTASFQVRKERREELYPNYSDDNEDDLTFFENLAQSHHETRPEWGLANNAAMFIAPRELTKGINLRGRTFLNEYDYSKDPDFEVLNKIIAGPLTVAHWINMQYFVSTVDNNQYGSGDKTIHNVVGEGLGVLSGSSGDLRIGLPIQSLHDGSQWMHQPLRLNLYIAMPVEILDQYLQKNIALTQLVNNKWLNLLCVDTISKNIHLFYNGQWINSIDY